MKLFLFGAPCNDTDAEQQMLATRGYITRSLIDIQREHGPIAPRELKKLRALDMLSSAAVLVVDHDDREVVRSCGTLCRELGVPMVMSHDLPWTCPHKERIQETIDACDISYVRIRTRSTAQPAPQRVLPRTIGARLRHLFTQRHKAIPTT